MFLFTENDDLTVSKDNSNNGQTVITETESKWTRPVLFGNIRASRTIVFHYTGLYFYTSTNSTTDCCWGPLIYLLTISD